MPDELLSRLATLVPPSRTHALRYHGLFAPNSKHRARVVPAGAGRAGGLGVHSSPHGPGDHLTPDAGTAGPEACARPEPPGTFRLTQPGAPPPDRPAPRTRVPWADLLRKVFAIDVLECPRCAGRLDVIAFIAEHGVAKRILDHLGLDSQAPPLAKARGPDDPGEASAGPDYHAGDPIYDE